MSILRQAVRVAGKDLRIELRSREIVYTMAFFGGLLVVIYTFAFPRDEDAVRGSLPGMLWVTMAFTGTIGLGRAFDREAISIAALMLAVVVVVAPLLALFLNAPLFAHPGPLALALVLGVAGFATVGTVFAATLLKVRSRDVLLPVILYPLLVPLFVSGTEATAALIAVRPSFDTAWYWIKFLGMYDAVFLVLSLWIFESLVIE
jgi:ABC-type transport system involved in cytochrome c biogenesis permease component